MNIQRSNPINISRYGRSRHKSHDFEELSCLRTTESHQSFSPNLGSPSPPETPDSSHCISRIGDYLLLEPLEGDHVFRAAHLHSGEELVCKVSRHSNATRLLPFSLKKKKKKAPRLASLPLRTHRWSHIQWGFFFVAGFSHLLHSLPHDKWNDHGFIPCAYSP